VISTSIDRASPAAPCGPRFETASDPGPTPRERDAAHVRRFLAGEESAFNEIMSLHRERLFAIVMAVVRDPCDAEELVQDTFVRAYRGLAAFRGDSSLATWLYHIAVNLARNRYWYFRRRQRHNACSFDAVAGPDGMATIAEMIADAGPDPAQKACHGEFYARVRACLDRLSPGQREILSMRWVLDMSYVEIGSRLGVRAGTVKSRIARARQNLRALLAESYPGTPRGAADHAHWFESARATGRAGMAG